MSGAPTGAGRRAGRPRASPREVRGRARRHAPSWRGRGSSGGCGRRCSAWCMWARCQVSAGRAGVDAAPRDPLVQRAAQQRPEEVREPRGLRSSGDALSGLRAAELGRAGPGWAELHRPWDSRSSDTWLPRFSPLLYAGPQRAESGPGTTSHRYPSSLWMTSGGSSYG